ncbi:uncharacterized protein YBL107C [Kluyveromyces marxianus DMKU3-1042]|mgnify:CR=1 FL=1|uniref:Uncharacterized protein YBL107C n=1 Tax=Kluyveromyces marxianus (strain DMKU3-1042 / BCC 29191 / NBRC 104275) TaxID=1003335 RepID=W0TGP5_KLUMD|nr:uncharacterized protein KLMA_70128 [Kluyveromyces marxianus DMKU3-1042]BAO41976.1 uncharacterized protein YBL107C [Kluyveromyces marxianus DMKU3-1042]
MGSDLIIDTQLPEFDDAAEAGFLHKDILFDPNGKLVINRERCINPKLIDNFFRFLRHGSDDVLKQKLNNNKSATNQDRNCDAVLKSVLYPNWKIRHDIISYCENELNSMQKELNSSSNMDNENQRPIVTERIDPYAVKDMLTEKENRFKDYRILENWISNQKNIESIIQIRTSSVLSEQCGNNRDYIREFENFIKANK